MPESRPGMCARCRYASTCTYRAAAVNPVLECDEFLELVAVERVNPEKASRTTDGIQENGDNKFRGLCYDCRNRKGCRMAQMIQGGALHCEEYR
jgi:hypothetical protein